MSEKPLLEFPCVFPIKAIGTGPEDFEALVLDIVRRHVAIVDESASTSRPSGGGKYVAVTVTFTANSQAQIDALYSELGANERVVMLL